MIDVLCEVFAFSLEAVSAAAGFAGFFLGVVLLVIFQLPE